MTHMTVIKTNATKEVLAIILKTKSVHKKVPLISSDHLHLLAYFLSVIFKDCMTSRRTPISGCRERESN